MDKRPPAGISLAGGGKCSITNSSIVGIETGIYSSGAFDDLTIKNTKVKGPAKKKEPNTKGSESKNNWVGPLSIGLVVQVVGTWISNLFTGRQ